MNTWDSVFSENHIYNSQMSGMASQITTNSTVQQRVNANNKETSKGRSTDPKKKTQWYGGRPHIMAQGWF